MKDKDSKNSLDMDKKPLFDKNVIENVFKNLPNYVFCKDNQFIYRFCNDQFLKYAGLQNYDDVIGKSDFEMPWGETTANLYREEDIEVMESGNPIISKEVLMKTPNLGERILLISKRALYDKDNNIVGILGIYIDITERKKQEEIVKKALKQAEVASESKSEFIANMSHDIRTPITGILGLTQDMINTADEAQNALPKSHESIEREQAKSHTLLNNLIAKVQEDGDLLMGATDELLQLCNEILEVVQLESGKVTERLESFNIHELMQHNIELLQPVARHKHLDLSYEIAVDVPVFLKGLSGYLDRSLLNLISNALKFTETGFVKVTTQLVNSNAKTHPVGNTITLQITVEDTGIGIPEDKFDAIFENFSRLTSSYQGLYKGAGLGLYTVKRYVDEMKGRITVDSEVGKGTRFTLILPFTVSDHADRQKEPFRSPKPTPAVRVNAVKDEHATPVSQEKATATILLVEDSAIAALALKSPLKSLGCAIDVATTGAQAVSMAERNHYDLILMDIGLPDFSGVEATKKIRALSDLKKASVPIVAVTGHAGNADKRQEALDAGMQEVINKPAQKLALELILDSYVLNTSDQQPIKPTATDDMAAGSELAVLDWDSCVHMCVGDPDMARELLSLLADDLKKTAPLIANHYKNNDTRALRDTLHHIRGGVCYLKLPQLDHALKVFHEAVKADPQNPLYLEKKHAELQCAIQRFLKTWETEKF